MNAVEVKGSKFYKIVRSNMSTKERDHNKKKTNNKTTRRFQKQQMIQPAVNSTAMMRPEMASKTPNVCIKMCNLNHACKCLKKAAMKIPAGKRKNHAVTITKPWARCL